MEGKKILIVEDDEAVRGALVGRFSQEGMVVIEAVDGQDGLNKALTEHPDIILSDIIMPVLDGISMLRKLRENDWGKEAKVIILTNLSDSQDVDRAVKLGSHDYLVKIDWSLSDLVDKVISKLS